MDEARLEVAAKVRRFGALRTLLITALAKRNPQRAKHDADTIIKNTYRTLMTRAMKGCYIYCTDPETGRYFKKALSAEAAPISK